MAKDMTLSPTLTVRIGQYSDAGRKPRNQDFHGAVVPEGAALGLKGITLAIADGISTSDTSAEAAQIAVVSLLSDHYATSDAWTARTSVNRVVAAANAWLHSRNLQGGQPDVDRWGLCTLTALVLKGRCAHVFNIGDSAVWRVSGQSLEPLTQAHRISRPGGGGWLARAMGAEPRVEPDYLASDLSLGDTFLLTTDGVHDHWEARTVLAILRDQPDADEAARAIALHAMERGSDDNLTVQVARIESLPEVGAASVLAGAGQLPVPPLPRAGDWIDGYRILRELHASARSHVYLAEVEEGGKVALKIPSSEMREDPDYLRRFMLEEWIARRMISPHVLRAPALGTRTALYTLAEYVEGQTLRQWMTDNPRPSQEEVRDITDQIARGLRVFHRKEMIHQDLRPENIMLDRDGTVKIIDLGSTTVAGVEEAAPGTLGEMPGTFQYTAPEYLSGDMVSWRSDQFSLGVIAYEMLTGRLPYGAQVARVRSLADQRRLGYASARDEQSGVPGWMDAALRRACHPDPARRYDALSEFVADLRRPGAGWRADRQVPLAERNPVRFWQTVSAILAVVCLILAVHMGG